MAVWLLARQKNDGLPLRLAYVVDRRVVVDQAATEAKNLKDKCGDLPISTLRGKYHDNGEWLNDPTVPAIIVGYFAAFENWISTTECHPTRHGKKRKEKEWIVDNLLGEFTERRLPKPVVEIIELDVGPREGVCAKLRITFPRKIKGPILIGRKCHFGEGPFVNE